MSSIFHNPTIEIAVAVQKASRHKFGAAPNSILRDAFFILTHDSILVHRAIGALVDAGWPAAGGPLLRTLMDMNISALALAHSSDPEVAAFRYFYSGFRRHARDQRFDAATRKQMFEQIRNRLNMLPPGVRRGAIAVVRDKDRPYWFCPEWSSPSAIAERFGGKDIAWTYLQLSGTAHGTFLGMRLHRENPDAISINPEEPGGRALSLDCSSCRFLLELLTIRDGIEALGLGQRISDLMADISRAALGPPPGTSAA